MSRDRVFVVRVTSDRQQQILLVLILSHDVARHNFPCSCKQALKGRTFVQRPREPEAAEAADALDERRRGRSLERALVLHLWPIL
jgi:hypothetical protein